MNTVHDYLAEIARAGAGRFASTSLASSHAGVTRRVRRHRTARAAATTVAGIGVIGGGTWGGIEAFARGSALAPGLPASGTATSSPLATPDSLPPGCANAALLITDPSATAYPNGNLPAEVLCEVTDGWGTVTLRADAGVALESVIASADEQGIEVAHIYEGYRSLQADGGVSVHRGELADGTANASHGTGLALDVSDVDGSLLTPFAQLAASFGWTATDATRPWHFEFQPGTAAQGAPVVDIVTLPEGTTLNAIAAKLAEAYAVTPQDALSALTASVTRLIPDASTAEGWPMPGTYDLAAGTPLRDASDMLVAARVQELTDLGVPRADWQTVITKASLVEREAKLNIDKPKIARVIQNRLDQGMKLELDSTVRFAAPGETVFITDAERATDSPYNTYLYQGLPPGAIAAPSDEAVRAELSPAEGDWLYFVTVNFTTGETAYATTFEEHQANVALLQQWINANSGT